MTESAALGAPTRAVGLEPLESVLVLTPGEMLVAPVEIRGSLPVGAIAVRVGTGAGENGAELRGVLVWIGVRARGQEPGTPAYALDWMGDPGRWSVTEAGLPIRPDATGMWAVAAPVPAGLSLRGATTVTIGARPVPAVVLDGGGGERGGWPVFSPPAGLRPETVASMQASPWLARTLAASALSPLNRWRSRLAWRLLGRPDLAGEPVPGRVPLDAISDPVLEGLARQIERRWAAGLARVHSVDPAAASELAWRVAAVVDMGGGVAMPAWGAETEALRRLGEDLVNPLLSAAEAASRARAWVAEQPPAVAWIADDAGLFDAASGAPITVAGVANLTLEPALAWAAYEEGARSADLAAAGALSTGRVACVAPGPGEVRMGRVSVGVGGRTMVREAAPAVVPVRPPGLRIGPLVGDMSMASWLAHAADAGAPMPRPADPAWTTAALLHRGVAGGAGGESGKGGADGWVLYIECRREPAVGDGAEPVPEPGRTPPSASPPGIGQVQRGPVGEGRGARAPVSETTEELRIWLGPAGSPTSRLRVFTSGLMLDDAAPGRPAERVAVRDEPDRWSCWVPLPARALPADGRLRIGIERTDARGVRTAWPRPMLPWQREPGRVVVDLTAWDR